ncbi:TIGR00730 family Rossman fold protein [Candidatus Dependentiae bacterium]
MFLKRVGACCSEFAGLFRVVFQIMYGSWKLSYISQPRITIFGGSRLGQKTKFAQQAFDLAQKFVKKGISVLTGGGSGVMHAANCGAISKEKGNIKSVGIGVKELGEGKNPCVQEYFELEYFFARKWLLTRYSIAFVVFPGGFGTMDELAEVLTLINTNKLPRIPIVMVGKEYWHDFFEWTNEHAVKHGLIERQDLELFVITDDINEVFEIVKKECDRLMSKMKK